MGLASNHHDRYKFIRSRVLVRLNLIGKDSLFPTEIDDLIDTAEDSLIGELKIQKLINVKMVTDISLYDVDSKKIAQVTKVETSWGGLFDIIPYQEAASYDPTGGIPLIGYFFAGKLKVKPTPTSDCGYLIIYALMAGRNGKFDPEAEPELPEQFDQLLIDKLLSIIAPEDFNYKDKLEGESGKYHNKAIKEYHVRDNW